MILKSLSAVTLAILVIGVLCAPAARAQEAIGIDTSAEAAMMIEFDTGMVLLEKAADARTYPASMTKLMTAYLVFERLKNGTLSLDDTFLVSEKAWRKGGSKMWVEVGERARVEDLLRGIIVQSGNDATITVAEGLAGSEEAFARRMTEKARELGMMNTQFRNSSGWPDEEHYSTARDLAILATAIIRDFPEYYHFYSETEFTYADITQQNRNPLLYRNIGADGLKTGHTEASGYGLTSSAIRDGLRLVLVVNGLESQRARAQESERLLDWGFREFSRLRLFEAGETVGEAPVWLGTESQVPLIIEQPLDIVMRRTERDDLKVVLRTEEPIAAPITPGTVLGEVVVTAPGMDTVRVPVVAGEPVERLGSFGRLRAAIEYLVFGGAG
jgi:D-alanyl-D-alanine carboxypeptidase (penicillin-binding protein 5/6)